MHLTLGMVIIIYRQETEKTSKVEEEEGEITERGRRRREIIDEGGDNDRGK